MFRLSARRGALVTVLVLICALAPSSGSAPGDFPQVKIDWIDSSAAPEIRLGLSILDSRLRPPPMKAVKKVTVLDAPPRMETEPLFSATFDHGFRFENDEEVPVQGEEAPTLRMAREDEAGLAAVVIVPGYGDPAYQRGSLGARTWGAAGLLLKKLESARQMNVLWVGDEIWTWIDARGRRRSLTAMTPDIRDQCEATRRESLVRGADAEESASEEDEDASVRCGLTTAFSDLAPMIKETTAQGFYPHLFGLSSPVCGTPTHERNVVGMRRVDQDDEDEELDLGPSAIEVALKMLLRDAAPERAKAIVILGDGRDGYSQPQSECMVWARARCAESEKSSKERAHCVEETLNKVAVAEQERFLVRGEKIIALAKAAGVRIFTVSNSLSSSAERERLEVLAWRTGGTARVAEDPNQVVDRASDLLDELQGELIVSFRDERAVPGASLRYRARVQVGGALYRTSAMGLELPLRPVSLRQRLGDAEAMGRERLGDTGFLVAAGVLALLLAFIGFKILKGALGLVWRRA
ncbi:MAG: hypothetical protein CL940_03090 [Deltaproteobacteria bacterium]|nr:hypothetical protein [Deltaproteobacteria bacterium]